jgi:hypothetical protein
MSKRIALKDFIEVDGHDLSNFARSVSFSSEHEQVDVSGFNALGTDEFLAGKTTQSVTVEFFGSYGSGEVHDVLYHLHRTAPSSRSSGGPTSRRGLVLRTRSCPGTCSVCRTAGGDPRRRRRVLCDVHRGRLVRPHVRRQLRLMADERSGFAALRELVRATDRAGKESKTAVRGILRAAALHVRVAATELFARVRHTLRCRLPRCSPAAGRCCAAVAEKDDGVAPRLRRSQMRKGLLPALQA